MFSEKSLRHIDCKCFFKVVCGPFKKESLFTTERLNIVAFTFQRVLNSCRICVLPQRKFKNQLKNYFSLTRTVRLLSALHRMNINYRLKSSQAGCVWCDSYCCDQLGCQIKDHLRLRIEIINNWTMKIFFMTTARIRDMLQAYKTVLCIWLQLEAYGFIHW